MLENCLPSIPPGVQDRPIRLRAALASTFVADLEIARGGKVTLAQGSAFGSIRLNPAAPERIPSQG